MFSKSATFILQEQSQLYWDAETSFKLCFRYTFSIQISDSIYETFLVSNRFCCKNFANLMQNYLVSFYKIGMNNEMKLIWMQKVRLKSWYDNEGLLSLEWMSCSRCQIKSRSEFYAHSDIFYSLLNILTKACQCRGLFAGV